MGDTVPKKRIVIVDDHPMVRDHLAQIINKEPDLEVCGEADNIRQAMVIIRDSSPNLAIVDITLNGESGLDLVKSLKNLSIPTLVLVLSMHDESLYAERVLRAGAGGYITKQRPSHEVLSAIRHVLAGEIYLSNKMISGVLRQFAPRGSRGVKSRSIDALTDRELAVLELIGRGQASRAIAGALGVQVTTVETYRARIKEKLNLQNTFELQHFAFNWLRERG
jgi:DNA-binding NarL/FixJ family response regulator